MPWLQDVGIGSGMGKTTCACGLLSLVAFGVVTIHKYSGFGSPYLDAYSATYVLVRLVGIHFSMNRDG